MAPRPSFHVSPEWADTICAKIGLRNRTAQNCTHVCVRRAGKLRACSLEVNWGCRRLIVQSAAIYTSTPRGVDFRRIPSARNRGTRAYSEWNPGQHNDAALLVAERGALPDRVPAKSRGEACAPLRSALALAEPWADKSGAATCPLNTVTSRPSLESSRTSASTVACEAK